eukprot:tig00000692_g3205.t2
MFAAAAAPLAAAPSRHVGFNHESSPAVRALKAKPAAARSADRVTFTVSAECKKHVHVCTGGRCEPRAAKIIELFKQYAPDGVEVDETYGECLLECPTAVNAAMWTGDWDPDTKDTRPVIGYFQNRFDVATALKENLGVEAKGYKPPSLVEKMSKQNTISIEVVREGDPKWKP